MGAVKKRR